MYEKQEYSSTNSALLLARTPYDYDGIYNGIKFNHVLFVSTPLRSFSLVTQREEKLSHII